MDFFNKNRHSLLMASFCALMACGGNSKTPDEEETVTEPTISIYDFPDPKCQDWVNAARGAAHFALSWDKTLQLNEHHGLSSLDGFTLAFDSPETYFDGLLSINSNPQMIYSGMGSAHIHGSFKVSYLGRTDTLTGASFWVYSENSESIDIQTSHWNLYYLCQPDGGGGGLSGEYAHPVTTITPYTWTKITLDLVHSGRPLDMHIEVSSPTESGSNAFYMDQLEFY